MPPVPLINLTPVYTCIQLLDGPQIKDPLIISRGAEGLGREILQRPPSVSVCLSVRPSVRLSVRPSRLVFTL